jgi:carboxypeptidase family protein/TonB-dependent receptor-like protein
MPHACQSCGRRRCSDFRQFSTKLVLILLATLGVAGLSYSQADTATISGVITDQSGAVVAGAEVRVTNTDTNVTWTGTSNASGVYLVASVKPGQYRVHVGKEGFKGIDLTDLVLNIQDSISRNFTLQVGSTSESISVEGNELQINTQDASVSTVVDRQFAENLPMNGRSFQTLIQLTPGVVVTPSTAQDGGQFSVNGQRTTSNYWTVDGVSANIGVSSNSTLSGNGFAGALGSFSVLGGTNSLVSVDALQEFRIQTSTYAPEFGRTPGGQISIITRSGVNQFHGTAFDYLRNDVLDANDWFNGTTNPPLLKAEERQNDFGGTFSGPIRKDSTFFFFSYEGLRLRLPQTTLTTVPCDSSCQVFGNARAMAVSALQPYFSAYPLPNGPEVFTPCTPNVNGCPASGQQPTGAAHLNASYSNPARLDAYSLRIDHKLSSKWTLFGRYNYSPSELVQRGSGLSLSVLNTSRITTQTGTLGATWIVAPTITNDLRFNYSRTNASSSVSLDNFLGAVPLSSFQFPSPFTDQDAAFTFRIRSLPNNGSLAGAGQSGNLLTQANVVDNLSLQIGPHSLKFGVDFRRLSPSSLPPLYNQIVQFLNVSSAEAGRVLSSFTISRRSTNLRFNNLGVFAQDTWRIVPRLTLTYGLRWDVDVAPSVSSGPNLLAVTGFNLNNLANLALAPTGTAPFNTTYGNIAPRIGVAYQASQSQDWQTVVRGGFGVFYDLATSQAGNDFNACCFPFGSSVVKPGGMFPLSPAAAAPPPITPPNASNSQILYAFDPHLRLPYTLEWNVALEQALGKHQTISASYIGSAGRRLLQTALVNSPNPNLFRAYLIANTATSDYHALQLQFQRRLAHGLQALASYTWSHSIDDGSAGSYGSLSNTLPPTPGSSSNRGPSDFDIRSAFSAAITYDVPRPKINAFTTAILGGWSLQSVIQVRSAPPVDVIDTNFTQLSASGVLTHIRPDIVPGQPFYLFSAKCASVMQALGNLAPGQGCPGGKGLNPSAFQDPPTDPNTGNPVRQGNVPRNFLRGFGATQCDFAVHRDFPIRESLKLQFRAEIFNVLNHPNFGQPVGDITDPQFGVSTQMLGQSLNGGNLGGGAFDPLYQIGGPRSLQFGLKLLF